MLATQTPTVASLHNDPVVEEGTGPYGSAGPLFAYAADDSQAYILSVLLRDLTGFSLGCVVACRDSPFKLGRSGLKSERGSVSALSIAD